MLYNEMQLKITFTLILLVFSLVPGDLFAQQSLPGRSQHRIHPAAGAVDLDGDGVISATELNKAPEANKNALQKLISGFGRSFGTVEAFDFPGDALGYTDKVGTTTVAGKALN